MDLGDWLRGLGLDQYETAFRKNEIDATVLPNLTAEDLKDLGIGIVGHRRRLLDAIAALRADAEATAASTAAISGADSPSHAERRQVTVMFSDLVGSTALSARMDPEDLREVIGAYQKCVTETVRSFGGFVAKYLGDGVLIYFGYPQAHEDDAERAVRAGLASIDAVGRLDLGSARLQARVGIATGLVVVGDLVGEGSAQEQSVVGETPNLAARLQALAVPAALVIAAGTRQQIGELFELENLGPQQLAGFAEPQSAWRVLGESGEVSRFEALRSGTAPLVGRGEEVELLLRRWEQARTGEGRVVLISGEPGPERHRLLHQLYGGHDPGTCARYFDAQAHWLLGYPDKGLAFGNEALELAKRAAHPFSLVLALQYHSMVHLERGERELALQRLEAAEALAAEERLGFVIEPQLLRGAVLAVQGVFEGAVACLREGLAGPFATRVQCYGLAKLAEALTRQGEHGAALAAARDGLSTAEKTGHRQWEAELYRVEGIALSGLNKLDEGQNALEQAMRIARSQQAKAYELRAAMSMARLWCDRGKRQQARDLLAAIYGCFTEGFDTLDLEQARALLGELA